jgi:site-specific DNA recombinase
MNVNSRSISGAFFPYEEYHRQKKLLEMELESMVVPKANAAEEASKLIMDLPNPWEKANQEERRNLLLTMLDAVYVDAKKTMSIIAIKPKPPFKSVFQVAASRKGSDIRILNEPINGSSVFLVETGDGGTLPKHFKVESIRKRKTFAVWFV